jgi:hypothetical protein
MSSEFVMMPVPVDRVQEVYELLARPSVADGTGTADGASVIPLPWSDEFLRRAYKESSAAMKSVLDTLASRPGETVSVADLAVATGLDRRKVPGVLGAFGRRWSHRYDQGEANLPFKSYRSVAAGMTVYEMDEAVAAALTRVRPAAR